MSHLLVAKVARVKAQVSLGENDTLKEGDRPHWLARNAAIAPKLLPQLINLPNGLRLFPTSATEAMASTETVGKASLTNR